MASLLKVDALTGVTTAGSISVTGEGNSTTTNLQQGLAKAWAYFNGQAATPVFFDSLNCSSLTDVGTGTQAPQLTNPFSNNHFAQPSSAHASGVSWCLGVYTGGKTTNQMYLSSVNTSAVAVDANPIEGTAHGDLA
jgi:hypothetical protein